jgi:hypothetical protein
MERVVVAYDSRQKYPLLRYIPMHSEVWFVEIDLTVLVSPEVVNCVTVLDRF